MTDTAEHWGPVEAVWPTPDDMLQDDLLGFRVGWWMVMASLARDVQDLSLMMFSQVAEGARAAGVPIPAEWYPGEAAP